jgi:hypothetical protein
MARTAQISKDTTVHEYFKIWSDKAVAKTIKPYDETGSQEDRHRSVRPRVTSAAEDTLLELPASKLAVQVTDTSQHQLVRRDCVNQAFIVKLLQRNHY